MEVGEILFQNFIYVIWIMKNQLYTQDFQEQNTSIKIYDYILGEIFVFVYVDYEYQKLGKNFGHGHFWDLMLPKIFC